MKYIKIPQPITIKSANDLGEEISFAHFLEQSLLMDKRFGVTLKAMFSCEKIANTIRNASPGDVVGIEDADYEILKAVVEAPEGGYSPIRALPFISWLRLIVEASDSK